MTKRVGIKVLKTISKKTVILLVLSFFVLLRANMLICAEEEFPESSITFNLAVDPEGNDTPSPPIFSNKTPSSVEVPTNDLVIQPEEPLTAAITPQTPRRQAAALRLAEEGRRFLKAGEYRKALARFEKTIAIDPNPYIYYYLARTHFHLEHYPESLNFLEVAESMLGEQSNWMAELTALKGANFHALGSLTQADPKPNP
ncbi:MAG: tetratricopeptide repeat protein [Candidatus Binatia bacterium]